MQEKKMSPPYIKIERKKRHRSVIYLNESRKKKLTRKSACLKTELQLSELIVSDVKL